MDFGDKLDASLEKLIELEKHVNLQIGSHEKWLKESEVYPIEYKESKEEISAKYNTCRKECIRLEELLVRVQLALDDVKIPRIIIDNTEVPDPEARTKRKQVIQKAENLIKQIQKLRNSLPEKSSAKL